MKKEKLETICNHLNSCEIRAQKAARDSIKYKQSEFMSDKIGKVYNGIVNGIQDYGIFVSIIETACEGFIRLNEIGGDTFQADLQNYCVKGFNTGEVIKLGDEVTVVVTSVDIERKNINLTLIKL